MNSSSSKLQGSIVFKTFQLKQRLGTGAFGQIFLATNKQNQNQSYAVKAQPITTKHPQLVFQSKLYKYLNSNGDVQGIPKVHNLGMQKGYNLMMMDLLGPSLQDLFVKKNKNFSTKTVLMIGLQLIDRIQFMHSRSFLHRDIKPDNLLLGINNNEHIIYLVDMGLAKKYIKDGKHIPFKQGKQLTGTARYASISTHRGLQQSRRDDIQSIGYVLLYFLRGILPWQNMKAKTTKQKYNMIMNKKISTPISFLCDKYPEQFGKLIEYAKQLNFTDKPDYDYLKSLLKSAMKKMDFKIDNIYDWSK